MSLPATDRLTRALGNIHEQILRLEQDATKYGSPDPGGYPAALGLLLGSVRGRLSLIDHFLVAAREAAGEAWNPCTHEFGCLDCASAHERQEEDAA